MARLWEGLADNSQAPWHEAELGAAPHTPSQRPTQYLESVPASGGSLISLSCLRSNKMGAVGTGTGDQQDAKQSSRCPLSADTEDLKCSDPPLMRSFPLMNWYMLLEKACGLEWV